MNLSRRAIVCRTNWRNYFFVILFLKAQKKKQPTTHTHIHTHTHTRCNTIMIILLRRLERFWVIQTFFFFCLMLDFIYIYIKRDTDNTNSKKKNNEFLVCWVFFFFVTCTISRVEDQEGECLVFFILPPKKKNEINKRTTHTHTQEQNEDPTKRTT